MPWRSRADMTLIGRTKRALKSWTCLICFFFFQNGVLMTSSLGCLAEIRAMNFSGNSTSSMALKTLIVAFILKHEPYVRYGLGVALKKNAWSQQQLSVGTVLKELPKPCSFCDVSTRAHALSLLFQPWIMPKTTLNGAIFKSVVK